MGTRHPLSRARRVVVKVGSGLVTTPGEGPSGETIARLAADIATLVHEGREVALVSSGAIATGVARLGLKARPRSIPEKQAAAAVGQSALMWEYEQAFKKHGIPVGQVLLTGQDISDRSRYLNARNTLLALLEFGVLPVINENDTVAVDEIKVGDNDNLAALVAHLIDADLLVLLTDVDGLYTGNPRRDPAARRLERWLARRFAARVIAISGAVAAQLDPGNLVVVRDQPDRTEFSPARAGCSGPGPGSPTRLPWSARSAGSTQPDRWVSPGRAM